MRGQKYFVEVYHEVPPEVSAGENIVDKFGVQIGHIATYNVGVIVCVHLCNGNS